MTLLNTLIYTDCVQLHHQAVTLTQDEVRTALSHTDLGQMWLRDLRPLLVTRYPGSAGSQAVQEVRKPPTTQTLNFPTSTYETCTMS